MISIDRLKEMALEDIENNPEKHLEEYAELLQQLDQLKVENKELKEKIKYMEGYIKTVEKARDELERENKFTKEQAEQKLERIEAYCNEQNLKADYTACEILQIIDEVE